METYSVPWSEWMIDATYPAVTATPEAGDWTEVQPGVLWLRMPLPFKLDHVNLYLIEDQDGWFLIDTGINHHSSYAVWQRIVAEGLAGKPLKGMLVTHYHPDHVGGAGWLSERWQLPLSMTAPEYEAACAIQAGHQQASAQPQLDYYRRAGHDVEDCRDMARTWQVFSRMYAPLPQQYSVLNDGDRLPIGNDCWRVMVTKGHSPAHACFYNEDRDLLIAGDQVLPYISSNVSVTIDQSDANPLKHWLDGLARLALLPQDTLVLPAHNHPFYGLQSRVRELIDGHLAMLEQIVPLLDQPLTVKQLALRLFPQATQGLDLALATGETLAHLHYLVEQGRVMPPPSTDGPQLFRAARVAC